mmetsp:Transcript_4120/g.13024  ORF Transcript_4120/g.13024 Transcript_4120/m.13024 type:complete len:211 (-) Transcript_4120:2188-2820(-)
MAHTSSYMRTPRRLICSAATMFAAHELLVRSGGRGLVVSAWELSGCGGAPTEIPAREPRMCSCRESAYSAQVGAAPARDGAGPRFAEQIALLLVSITASPSRNRPRAMSSGLCVRDHSGAQRSSVPRSSRPWSTVSITRSRLPTRWCSIATHIKQCKTRVRSRARISKSSCSASGELTSGVSLLSELAVSVWPSPLVDCSALAVSAAAFS